jgi:NAD dependent epimerase/dehydratase family enzyme
VTNRAVTRALGRALHRPTLAAVPAFALRAVLGEFATGITCSSRAVRASLLNAGFTFRHPSIEEAVGSVLAPR